LNPLAEGPVSPRFVLRKATKGKEWKHLLKEPALTTYKKQHRIDWKKYDIDKDDDEFLVTKVNRQNLAGVVGRPGIVLMQFCPSWSSKAGLDEGLLQFSLSNLLYMENLYSYKKFQ
jgi:hypothetical protein